ncbi:hypothetical protein EEPDABAO_00033 [Klebsiella phage mfs]|uniref:DUF7274 domain-containing protein n=1 Tax=Klebsiella phage mfs TaxID=2985561 RepID=A0A9X9JWH4_9CAUD|nr:hypothetical protein EEPDABAO_00033 [Klebsiella phage mfs]
MPRFNRTLQLRTFAGYQIPKESTKAVSGREFGVYFHWQGKWRFTVIHGFYVTCDGVDIDDYRGGNQIQEFNKCKP